MSSLETFDRSHVRKHGMGPSCGRVLVASAFAKELWLLAVELDSGVAYFSRSAMDGSINSSCAGYDEVYLEAEDAEGFASCMASARAGSCADACRFDTSGVEGAIPSV